MRTARKILIGLGVMIAAIIAIACASNVGGSSKTPAQVPASSSIGTGAAPAPAAQPVKLSGRGEGVVQAALVKGGYTLAYTSSNGFMIVAPVNSDGTDGQPWVLGASTDGAALSGTTVVHATGPTAVHVSDVDGSDWTMTFTPLG